MRRILAIFIQSLSVITLAGCDGLEPHAPAPGEACGVDAPCGEFTCYQQWCHVDPAAPWHCRAGYDDVFPCLLPPGSPCRSGRWQCTKQQCLPELASLFDGAADAPCRDTESSPPAAPASPSWLASEYCSSDWWERPDSPFRPSDRIRPVLLAESGAETRLVLPCPAGGWCALAGVDAPVSRSTTCTPSIDVGAYAGRRARWTFVAPEDGAYRLWLANNDPPVRLPEEVRFGDTWLLVRRGDPRAFTLPARGCLLTSPPTCDWDAFGVVISDCAGLRAGIYDLYMLDHVADARCECDADTDDCAAPWVAAPLLFFDIR